LLSFVFSYYPFSYHSTGSLLQTYTAKFGCFKYDSNPDGSGTESWFKYSCAATGTNDVVLTEHSAAGCADDTKTVFAKDDSGDADVKKFTYTNTFQYFAIPDGGGWTTKQERKAISYIAKTAPQHHLLVPNVVTSPARWHGVKQQMQRNLRMV
jgi:hypothetical protein